MRRLFLLLCLLWPVTAAAQVAPAVVTTLRTTDTSTTSIKVGCTSGGSCTGGITGGPIDVSSITSGGFIGIASNVPVSTTMRLYNDSGTLKWNGTTLATGGSISGTPGKLAKFTAADAVGDSICSESGTTITCVNTISATTLTGTLSTATQNSVTTMTGLVTVGTIGTGVWQGTKVGLAYGGTNADLSGTGGTSQFLRQNTLGGAVSVVRPAVADLSDGSNVALLNAANTFTNGIALSKAGPTAIEVNDSTSADSASIDFKLSGTRKYRVGVTSAGLFRVYGDVLGDNALTLSSAGLLTVSGGIVSSSTTDATSTSTGALQSAGGLGVAKALWVGGLANIASTVALGSGTTAGGWGINAAGDWTFGPSAHIADSVGTPTCSTNCASIVGTDYAFTATGNVGPLTSMNITLGHNPAALVCTAGQNSAAAGSGIPVATAYLGGSVLVLAFPSTASPIISVICRGY